MRLLCRIALLALVPSLAACARDEAVRRGVGAGCTSNQDCQSEGHQRCLTEFKGGYCGVVGCTGDLDCPDGSRCVAHAPATNYCFLECADKDECNVHRPLGADANCSANVDFIDGKVTKACVPPSGTAN